MFDWIYRLIGKEAAKKLELEGNMTDTPEMLGEKHWYKSKAIWSAILGCALGAVQPISTAFGHPVTVPNWVFEVLAGMGLYALRTAKMDIK